jgi:polyisoprenoid-binding protein YceI
MTLQPRSLLLVVLTAAATLAYAAAQWNLQPKDSTLTFVGKQAGAEFQGSFDKFTADITFDPENLAASRFDVQIDTASVNTHDTERDDTLRGAELFNVKKWPKSQYVAEKFADKGGGKYTAAGKLTLRDVTREVPIEFTFEQRDGGAWLKGSSLVKRLDFGVGQGEWKETDTVANDVKIRFALKLGQGK